MRIKAGGAIKCPCLAQDSRALGFLLRHRRSRRGWCRLIVDKRVCLDIDQRLHDDVGAPVKVPLIGMAWSESRPHGRSDQPLGGDQSAGRVELSPPGARQVTSIHANGSS